MKTTLMKLRIAGIAAFLLFFLSALFNSPSDPGFYFSQVQKILIVVSFVIFALLIVIQLYRLLAGAHVKEEETGQ